MAERPQRLVAHTPPEGSDEWHYLDDHLQCVAHLSASFAAPFGAGELAWWCGILHDLGKVHSDFQDYLWKNYREPDKKHPTVDHKTAGAVKSRDIAGDVLTQIILGHHGGLSDLSDANGKIRGYTQTETDRLNLSLDRFQTLNLVNDRTHVEHPPQPPAWFSGDTLELDMLMRMLFSALVDADALDTEAHWKRDQSAIRQETWPAVTELHERFMADQAKLNAQVAASPVATSTINQVRREVYEACIDRASLPSGFFRLTVPTGGGKTRSGLAFALEHAIKHRKRRIVVAVPFITITEQTADVYTNALGCDALIEHHSGLEPAGKANRDDPDDSEFPDDMRKRLVAQNWDAPLIVTTTVQLFESLFTNRVSRARKLHNLAGSVIILDEIQTLPPELRGPIHSALLELVDHYDVSVVLSTATQPVLDSIASDLEKSGRSITELAPDPPHLFTALKRVNYELPCMDETWDWERVAEEMRSDSQAMTIVNTIANARDMFGVLADEDALHLSTRMCGAHRRDVLADVRNRLKDGEPCHLVSTQLVEAGVDLDFPLVLRVLAPLDRIVQAAGRCNREGNLDAGRVVVFGTEDNAMPPGIFRQGADETRIMLQHSAMNMADPGIFLDYFERLYGLADPDTREIQPERATRNFASVGERMHLIDDDTFPVLVNYPAETGDREQQKAWNAVRAGLIAFDAARHGSLRNLMREAQPWLVQVRWHERDRLLANGSIQDLVSDVLWEWKDRYHEKIGITDTRLDPTGTYV